MGPGGLSHKRVHAPLLSFANVGKRRREGERESVVLEGVSFELQAGSALGLYGSGARASRRCCAWRSASSRRTAAPCTSTAVRCKHLRGERARLLRGPIALLTLSTAGLRARERP